jgi:hypothetical protein
MRRLLPLLVAGVVCAFPAESSAQVPRQDSVSISGIVIGGHANFVVTTLTATSGPSGESPSGQVSFIFAPQVIAGPVTCLAVRGNTATLNFQDQTYGVVTVQVTDNHPDTYDAINIGRAATDCSPLPATAFGGAVTAGDIIVIDAPPSPNSTQQCKNSGWKSYRVFKNQGDCVSFVATEGKNQPGGPA